MAERIRQRSHDYGLEHRDLPGLLSEYDSQGFAHRDYPRVTLDRAGVARDYGVSISSPAWVCKQLQSFPRLRLLYYMEQMMDNHEDVVACVKRPRTEDEAAQEGFLDSVSEDGIAGWAWDRRSPTQPLRIEILDGAEVITSVLGDGFRNDLAQQGKGDGRHGFGCELPTRLGDRHRHVIQARVEGSGVCLGGAWAVSLGAAGPFCARV